jgi:hypothetical protein
MVTLAAENNDMIARMGRGVSSGSELALRAIGAVLQLVATVAVVRTMPAEGAGVYFRGVIIAYGLAALLRGKYELFVAQRFIGEQQKAWDISARELVRGLGIRVLIRSALACAGLLVVTADLDVMDVYLRPYLQTYLPFVLAVPFATLALFLAGTLRAANRTLGSIITSSYGINAMITVAALAVYLSPLPALITLSWAFFVGSILACGIGVLLTRYVFEVPPSSSSVRLQSSEWQEIYSQSARNGMTGVALAGLQWGPACVLAVWGTAVEIAHFGVVARTAQTIDFLIPAVIFVPQSARIQSRLCAAMRTPRGKLAVDLIVSAATTSVCVLGVAVVTPWLVRLYGPGYSGLADIFVLLFAAQWAHGAGRPALRQLAADWKLSRIRRVLLTSMGFAILLSLVGMQEYGPVAAAAGMLAGALLENGQAVASALRRVGTDTRSP